MKLSASRLLFVCLGNICRSPAAEIVCRHVAAVRQLPVTIDSCGTAAYHVGERPDSRMLKALADHGFAYDGHRGRQFSLRDFDRFDLIIAQDDANKADLLARAQTEAQAEKIHCMREWFPVPWASSCVEVADPYYGGQAGFERTVRLLNDSCGCLLDSLVEQ